MFIIYDLIFFIVATIYLPVYLFKRKFHCGFLARLGFLRGDLSLNKPIWIHAVSVGEAMAVRCLVDELRKIYPDKKFVISTVTVTGNKIAQGIAKEGDFTTYLPLDLSFIVGSVIDKLMPSLFVIAETEIWPNLITYLYRRNIPVVTVNGRVSDASFKGYSRIKFLLKPILKKMSLFCVQTERDAERLMRLGVSKDKIQVTGNMKFDASARPDIRRDSLSINGERSRTIDVKDYADFKKAHTDYRQKLGLGLSEKLLVAASTHAGEEEIILNVYQGLIREFPHLRLLIAPRHPERTPLILNLIKKFGFEIEKISLLNETTRQPDNQTTIFILDTIGQLIYFYALADIVFVGGSLIKKGGHNILEPASLSKPILFGPYMFNFGDIADLFLNHKAAIKVSGQTDLKTNIAELLRNPSRAIELGRRAQQLILQNQGATRRNVEYIRNYGD
jgi:3-deoxy-D-manno-octulosonic-acid transferase